MIIRAAKKVGRNKTLRNGSKCITIKQNNYCEIKKGTNRQDDYV